MFLLAPGVPLGWDAPTPPACKGGRCLYRYRSSDGVRFQPQEALDSGRFPNTGDGCLVYRDPAGGYTAYLKQAWASGPGNLIPYASAPGDGALIIIISS